MNIEEHEERARNLMLAEVNIMDKHGWESGEEIQRSEKKYSIYKRELKAILKRQKIKKIPNFYSMIFTDANWHTMNKALDEMGAFENRNPYAIPSANRKFKEYQNKGGKTWELT